MRISLAVKQYEVDDGDQFVKDLDVRSELTNCRKVRI